MSISTTWDWFPIYRLASALQVGRVLFESDSSPCIIIQSEIFRDWQLDCVRAMAYLVTTARGSESCLSP